ncbi:MAG: 1-acyl-sn-glycerol-3-phosphate acyltransferase [Defluviitaleaceae bacterium]|nr:1-acyl-sn-glycerol-3-phosphate acyltransferase [Defluviitaleaceae bacterium]
MLYKIVKPIIVVLARVFYRFKVSGLENIPKEGAYLYCANHIHAFDPIVVAAFSRRQPRFMAKKELFKNRIIGALLRGVGAYPIDRNGSDLQAYRHSLALLKRGHGLLIFSQGTRMKDFESESAKGGVAMFALKSGAPIIPMGISGSYRIFSKMHLRVGKPIAMDQYQGQKVKSELINEVMAKVVEEVSKLC